LKRLLLRPPVVARLRQARVVVQVRRVGAVAVVVTVGRLPGHPVDEVEEAELERRSVA